MATAAVRSPVRLLAAAAILMVVKLVLVASQPVKAVASGSFDDQLFIALARQIALGNWLGDYTNLTLAKGPGAPLFFAVVYTLHIPLPIAQHILYGLVCLAIVFAIRPAVRRDVVLSIVFAIMLFNPMTFDAGIMTRVSRSHLYSSAILMSLVSLVGLATWRENRSARLFWIACAGLAPGLAWITREETAMIVPTLLFAVALMAFWVFREGSARDSFAYLWGALAAAVLTLTFVGVVATINLANYGTFDITEIRGGAFARAYGALTRIPPVDDAEHIAVTDEARRTAYAHSPAFRELEPYLEGERGDFWVEQSKYFIGLPTHGRGFHRGWFMWALRDAVADAGHYTSAKEATAFFDRMAHEINDACKDPALRCGPTRSTPRPALTPDRLRAVMKSWWSTAPFILTLDHFTAQGGPSIGDEEDVATFREWTRWSTSPIDHPPRVTFRMRVLQLMGEAFRKLAIVVMIASLGAWVAALVSTIRKRVVTVPFLLATASLCLVLSCTGAVAMVDGLAFPAVNMLYLAPAYSPLILFWCMAWVAILPSDPR